MNGKQYSQALVNQTPKYDNQVKKKKKKKSESSTGSHHHPKGGYR